LVGSATQSNVSTSASACGPVYTFAQAFNTWPSLTGQSFGESSSTGAALLQLKAG
jgi:hypothetical protein